MTITPRSEFRFPRAGSILLSRFLLRLSLASSPLSASLAAHRSSCPALQLCVLPSGFCSACATRSISRHGSQSCRRGPRQAPHSTRFRMTIWPRFKSCIDSRWAQPSHDPRTSA
eukprot:Amastigsp_a848268_214.p2 type:complete len:114 gc:universal Amastigsp_a848268_214:1069-728(-)